MRAAVVWLMCVKKFKVETIIIVGFVKNCTNPGSYTCQKLTKSIDKTSLLFQDAEKYRTFKLVNIRNIFCGR